MRSRLAAATYLVRHLPIIVLRSAGHQRPDHYTTIAYYAPTGARLWVKRYDPGNLLPAGNDDAASSLAVSPSGGTVFVTGGSTGATSRMDYATVAYNAATGAQQWVNRYNGPASYDDYASSVAVSPTGDRVFVTGGSDGGTTRADYASLAYSG
jgi:WD40 repeat protein